MSLDKSYSYLNDFDRLKEDGVYLLGFLNDRLGSGSLYADVDDSEDNSIGNYVGSNTTPFNRFLDDNKDDNTLTEFNKYIPYVIAGCVAVILWLRRKGKR